MMMGGGMGLWMLLVILIGVVAVTGGLVIGARMLKQLMTGPDQPPARTNRVETGQRAPSALERAQERYVRGEIDHAEFERLLDEVLESDQRSIEDR